MMGNFCIPVIDIDCRKNDYDGDDFDEDVEKLVE